MSVKAMRDAIVSAIGAACPPPVLREVIPYDGQLSDADLRRVLGQAPAAYVSCLGFSEVTDEDDDIVATAQWVVTLVTRRQTAASRSEASRSDAATAILETLVPLIVDSNSSAGACSTESAGRAEKVRARNMFSVETDGKGVSLWVVTWEQDVSLEPWSATALDDLLTVQTKFRMGDHDADDAIADSDITTTLEAP